MPALYLQLFILLFLASEVLLILGTVFLWGETSTKLNPIIQQMDANNNILLTKIFDGSKYFVWNIWIEFTF